MISSFLIVHCSPLIAPMMAEIMALSMEGVGPERLDKAHKKFGWPVGAITLADEVGIDVAAHVQAFMTKVCWLPWLFRARKWSASCCCAREFVVRVFRVAKESYFPRAMVAFSRLPENEILLFCHFVSRFQLCIVSCALCSISACAWLAATRRSCKRWWTTSSSARRPARASSCTTSGASARVSTRP